MKEHSMNICIITEGYPTPNNPGRYVFVDQLASTWADMGMKVSVIYPIPYLVEYYDKKRFYKEKWEKHTRKGNVVSVYSPRFFRISDKKIGFIETQNISYYSFQRAVIRTIDKLQVPPDVIYSHFLPSGCHAGDIGNQMSIHSFCAFGESMLWSIQGWNINQVKASLGKLTGMISVSTENKRILVDNGFYRETDIEVFPNGVDHSLFFQRDKQTIRKQYGFPTEAFIGAFTGSFNDEKGVLRAQEAAIRAGNTRMIYIGGGELTPEGDNILFRGRLEHERIPEYLCAADFFILPTKAEGCCNAIIEAMACGLPIISANGAYNDDILSERYSIRTDPTDIDAMREAIGILQNDSHLREEMSIAAKNASKRFDITDRAHNILDFMQRKMKKG